MYPFVFSLPLLFLSVSFPLSRFFFFWSISLMYRIFSQEYRKLILLVFLLFVTAADIVVLVVVNIRFYSFHLFFLLLCYTICLRTIPVPCLSAFFVLLFFCIYLFFWSFNNIKSNYAEIVGQKKFFIWNSFCYLSSLNKNQGFIEKAAKFFFKIFN